MPCICGHRLGMEDGSIPDSRITASSTYDKCNTSYGRLNEMGTLGYAGWCSGNDNTSSSWFQVDLATQMQVEGVIMQGSHDSPEFNEWVTAYQVQYSDGETIWRYVRGTSSQTAQVRFMISQIMASHMIQHFIQVMPFVRRLVRGCDQWHRMFTKKGLTAPGTKCTPVYDKKPSNLIFWDISRIILKLIYFEKVLL